jgi:hypothetical protein
MKNSVFIRGIRLSATGVPLFGDEQQNEQGESISFQGSPCSFLSAGYTQSSQGDKKTFIRPWARQPGCGGNAPEFLKNIEQYSSDNQSERGLSIANPTCQGGRIPLFDSRAVRLRFLCRSHLFCAVSLLSLFQTCSGQDDVFY